MSKKPDLFEQMDALFNKKPLELSETSSDGFIILRFLATDKRFAQLCEELSIRLGAVGSKRVCEFLQTVLPRAQRFRPASYFKKLKIADPKILEMLATYFLCTKEQAEVYQQLLEAQGVDLHAFFGINDNIKAQKKKAPPKEKKAPPAAEPVKKRSKLCF